MELGQVINAKRENSNIEYLICESLESAREQVDLYKMTSDFIINAMNMSKRNAGEMSVAFQSLFEQEDESFAQTATFTYYISALEFWNVLAKQDANSNTPAEVIENVDHEVDRCKDILFMYLMKGLTQEVVTHQMNTFRRNFNISDQFNDEMEALMMKSHKQCIEQLVLKLANE